MGFQETGAGGAGGTENEPGDVGNRELLFLSDREGMSELYIVKDT